MINLHVHTKHSLDGTLDINDVLNICEENGIDYVSITDHNTCDAYKDIKSNYSGVLINGIEVDALIGKETYDILCYGFNLENVSKWAKEQYTTIEERQTKIYNALKKLCVDKSIHLDESKPFNPQEEYAHAAVFRMLDDDFKTKYDIKQIGDLYRESTINERFPLYMDMSIVWPTIEEVSSIIHANGGFIFLAHPYKYGKKDPIELLNQALPYIDGIEVYNQNTEEETEYLYNFAKQNNKLMSCGSDFHGTIKHGDIKVNLSDDLQQNILNWINNSLNTKRLK